MRKLETYFENPFHLARIALDDKKKLGEDHLARLAVNNTDNRFDQLIADFGAAQVALFGEITNVELKLSLQQSHTMSVDNIILKFTKRNSRLNKYFDGTDLDPVIREQFFSGGVTEFTRDVNKGNVEQRIDHMISVITLNTAAAGGAPVLTEYNLFKTQYTTARGTQLTEIGAVASGRTNRDTAEAHWDDEAFKNTLSIALLYRDQPNMVNDFFDQKILQAGKNADNDGKGRYSGNVTLTGTSTPIEGVLIHIVDGNINDATTDALGRYLTRNLKIGIYKIRATKDGYEIFTAEVEVLDKGTTTFDIKMKTL